MLKGRDDIERVLTALGEQLENLTADLISLVVCGGSALNILDFIHRATNDIDVVAVVGVSEGGEEVLLKADVLPPEVEKAATKVARDFDLPDNWLNTGPASAMDLGLPEGLMQRAVMRQYGPKLTVYLLGRLDQIHFKLYAIVDQGAGKHLDDLLALQPSAVELQQAARWSMTHDVSEGFRQSLKDFLRYMGHENVADRL
jgi:hypothetical protein